MRLRNPGRYVQSRGRGEHITPVKQIRDQPPARAEPQLLVATTLGERPHLLAEGDPLGRVVGST
jgi:hypothetical protein